MASGGYFNQAPREPEPTSGVKRLEVREVDAPYVAEEVSRIARHWTVAVAGSDSAVMQALAKAIQAAGYSLVSPDIADALVYFAPLASSAGDHDVNQSIAIHRQAFELLRARADAIAAAGGAFITVQDTGGDFGLIGAAGSRAWSAGLPGLVKSAAQEWPNLVAKAIDVESDGQSAPDVAERIAHEILFGGTEIEVGLRADGRRTTLAMELTSPTKGNGHAIDARSVVVASGGGRGVTAAALIALARASRARFALLGRTALVDESPTLADCRTDEALKRQLLADAKAGGVAITPRALQQQVSAVANAREVRATLAAMRAVGSEAEYHAVDIQDAAALEATLDAVRAQWGRIDTIVHGAGVLADKPIARKTNEEFDRVMSVKVAGLNNLLHATRTDTLRSICLFSSIVARTGNAGQSDYATANTVLDVVAATEHRRRGGATVVKSINWGPWAGGMVTPALAEHFRSRGMSLIPLDAGADAFVREAQGASAHAVSVVIV